MTFRRARRRGGVRHPGEDQPAPGVELTADVEQTSCWSGGVQRDRGCGHDNPGCHPCPGSGPPATQGHRRTRATTGASPATGRAAEPVDLRGIDVGPAAHGLLGEADIQYYISRATPGYTVVVDITVTANGATRSCSTSFTPQG
ncbi:MAG TPA: hypothetical protein VEO01_29385 [Pseudonocardiaceae bacterium]|nr:hypothetical protein [Pseudonocardiaceae bacterium]